jgi:endonuclease/exonuclease/phosphatase (EEP) superfamily protein YafD
VPAAATLAVSLLLTVCRVFTPSAQKLVMATAFVPFALVGYALAALAWWAVRSLGDRGRRRVVSAAAVLVSLLGLVFHAALLVPSYAGSHASGRPALTVLTSNLRLGLGDTTEITGITERNHADVVVLEEVTPLAFAGLEKLRQALPYLAGEPFAGARGTVVFSRYPLQDPTQLKVFNGAWVVHVAAPHPFSLVAVHTSQPWASPLLWKSDHRSLLWNTTLAVRAGPVVMAGDFNATLDHRPMRDLLGLGLSDAARQANSGWQPTWPSDPEAGHSLPFGLGAMAIDHVLVSKQFSTISTRTFRVARSDHRAVLARIALS